MPENFRFPPAGWPADLTVRHHRSVHLTRSARRGERVSAARSLVDLAIKGAEVQNFEERIGELES